ncbi:hypothetical protein H5410_061368 [Solanum commersonii]|uniref:Uncharacterized protein n=1 Tax=Solanum commersonii TaxID=4109 RepID=A0A9J5W7T3_SOLCO|nr:hypothetical protein H5410_061368 [Solanum commersonii]
MKRSSRHVIEQFCEALLLLPNASKCENAKGKSRKVMKSTKRQIASVSAIPTNYAEWCFAAQIFKHYKYLGRKTKTTKLIAGGIRSTWVQLERVNPSPSPTHSARESEWAKTEAMLNAVTRCSRETELIRVERQSMDTIEQKGTKRLKEGRKKLLKIAFCSNALSLEGKGQVGNKMEQLACRQTVS